MHVIDKDGTIIEGQPLTPEELDILNELTEGGGINNASVSYVQGRDVSKIAAYLISKFHLSRREVPSSGDDSEETAS